MKKWKVKSGSMAVRIEAKTVREAARKALKERTPRTLGTLVSVCGPDGVEQFFSTESLADRVTKDGTIVIIASKTADRAKD